MAYANLLRIACADKDECFMRIRDFVCKRNGTYDYSATGIGWTLIDESYATDEDNVATNDYYVIYAPGEGGDDDLYFKITYASTTNFKIEGYQSWDNSTHTGTNRYNSVNNFYMVASAPELSVYGDLDFVGIFTEITTADCYATQFGKLLPGYADQSEDIVHCTSTLTAGSDVSITLDSIPSNWAVDKEVFIRTVHNDDMATVKIEKITIKTLVSNTITADLTYSYTTGAAVSEFVGYHSNNTNRFINTGISLIGPSGTVPTTYVSPVYAALVTGNFDPENFEDRFYMLDLYVASTFGLHGIMRHIKRVPSFVAGWAIGDILAEDDGSEWRAFQSYSTCYTCIKEV